MDIDQSNFCTELKYNCSKIMKDPSPNLHVLGFGNWLILDILVEAILNKALLCQILKKWKVFVPQRYRCYNPQYFVPM